MEDTRYQDLRAGVGGATWTCASSCSSRRRRSRPSSFSLPHALAAVDAATPLGPIAPRWRGDCGWSASRARASPTAQLARFKADPRQPRARSVEVGLWRYSRHPNYFFEWLVWCGFAVFALAVAVADGWASSRPALMLYTLLRVTGIPATEAAAVKRRGDAYREYQRTTSAFVPWFPASDSEPR